MIFNSYVAIDWSGDKSKFQKGISVSRCNNGQNVPIIIKPQDKYWTRTSLLEWLRIEINKQKILVGLDFSFS